MNIKTNKKIFLFFLLLLLLGVLSPVNHKGLHQGKEGDRKGLEGRGGRERERERGRERDEERGREEGREREAVSLCFKAQSTAKV